MVPLQIGSNNVTLAGQSRKLNEFTLPTGPESCEGSSIRNTRILDNGRATLRDCLRAATARSHDRLDTTMRRAGGWATAPQYARFLELQFAARRPVEEWLEANTDAASRPPAQTALIETDLCDLGYPAPMAGRAFVVAGSEAGELAEEALGAAWVLAGSSLGNRSIANELVRGGRGDWPSAFLLDPAMIAYWKALRTRLEHAADDRMVVAASRGAVAVFDHFLSHADASGPIDATRVEEAS